MTKTILDSQAAIKACLNFGDGWKVSKTTKDTLICTKPPATWENNCYTCKTCRMLVWKDGGNEYSCTLEPWCSVSTVAGSYYGGHQPCELGDNHPYCGMWTSAGTS